MRNLNQQKLRAFLKKTITAEYVKQLSSVNFGIAYVIQLLR